MSIELWSLVAVGVMAFVSIAVQATYTDLTAGIGWVLSSRDTPAPDQGSAGPRMERALRNQTEVATVWVPLVVFATHAGISNGFTFWASVAVIVSRILFFPFYALGLVPLRTLAWAPFFFGTPVFLWGILSETGVRGL